MGIADDPGLPYVPSGHDASECGHLLTSTPKPMDIIHVYLSMTECLQNAHSQRIPYTHI